MERIKFNYVFWLYSITSFIGYNWGIGCANRSIWLILVTKRDFNVEQENNKIKIPYFSDHKTQYDFSLDILEKSNGECILILVIYWKKTGLVHTKISNHNIIYSS